jgi:hypothetical protein
VADPVAILVLPPSFRVHWLLAWPGISPGVVKIDAGQQNEAPH